MRHTVRAAVPPDNISTLVYRGKCSKSGAEKIKLEPRLANSVRDYGEASLGGRGSPGLWEPSFV
jgi:hypothetical protein